MGRHTFRANVWRRFHSFVGVLEGRSLEVSWLKVLCGVVCTVAFSAIILLRLNAVGFVSRGVQVKLSLSEPETMVLFGVCLIGVVRGRCRLQFPEASKKRKRDLQKSI